jgi:hypothetical protein
MDSVNDSGNEGRAKKIGTREEVFKGLAARTAGGLKKDDIITKQFGARVLYISKKLSDKMRENFQHANYFRKRIRKTLVAPNNTNTLEFNNNANRNANANANANTNANGNANANTNANGKISNSNIVKHPHGKTQKLSFKVNNSTVKNVYYKELHGMNLQKLKEELKQEEVEEDLGILNTRSNGNSGEFKIEDVPEISLDDLE